MLVLLEVDGSVVPSIHSIELKAGVLLVLVVAVIFSLPVPIDGDLVGDEEDHDARPVRVTRIRCDNPDLCSEAVLTRDEPGPSSCIIKTITTTDVHDINRLSP